MPTDPANRLSRFLLFSKEFGQNAQGWFVKPRAFDIRMNEDPVVNRLEFSVCDTDNCGHHELMTDGTIVASGRGRELRGWFHVGKTLLPALELSWVHTPIEAKDGKPALSSHSDIIGWPQSEAGRIKTIARLIQLC